MVLLVENEKVSHCIVLHSYKVRCIEVLLFGICSIPCILSCIHNELAPYMLLWLLVE